jgi:hypothetical protein
MRTMAFEWFAEHSGGSILRTKLSLLTMFMLAYFKSATRSPAVNLIFRKQRIASMYWSAVDDQQCEVGTEKNADLSTSKRLRKKVPGGSRWQVRDQVGESCCRH